ncbi:hypothetical protein FB45DRAFT_1029798 [Roridomyces roridus]|uniref:CCHC-type domain-containing protein n=1 Tax=Roridomyces roridus TaxID=1738132 RepID=A0AAD7FJL8_9AGAR|nr:hypothetical protein FB45DRAFT_1029798 [Roridomyces roridus]
MDPTALGIPNRDAFQSTDATHYQGLDQTAREAHIFDRAEALSAATRRLLTEIWGPAGNPEAGLQAGVLHLQNDLQDAFQGISMMEDHIAKTNSVMLDILKNQLDAKQGGGDKSRLCGVFILQAYHWAENVVKAMRNGSGTGAYTTYAVFEADIISSFKGGAQVEEAQSKMEHLRQANGTAMSYFTILDSYNRTAGYDDTTLIRLLKTGLSQEVVESIYEGVNGELPKTYAGWKEETIKRDGLKRQFRVLKNTLLTGDKAGFGKAGNPNSGSYGGGGRNPMQNPKRLEGFNRTEGFNRFGTQRTNTNTSGSNTSNPTIRTSIATTASNVPAPMDIERTNTGRRQPSSEVHCYGCGLKGYIRRNCPTHAHVTTQFRAMVEEPDTKENSEEESPEDFSNDRD